MPAPDGRRVRVTPFVTVNLYGDNERQYVTAQYRMGKAGPEGVTRWTHWPPH